MYKIRKITGKKLLSTKIAETVQLSAEVVQRYDVQEKIYEKKCFKSGMKE